MAISREQALAELQRRGSTPQQQAPLPQMQQQGIGERVSGVFQNLPGHDVLQRAGQELGQFGLGALQSATSSPLFGSPGMAQAVNPAYRQSLGLGAPGLMEQLGSGAEKLGEFAFGGAGLGALRGGAEALPYAGRIAEYLGRSGVAPTGLRQGIGGGLFGAVQNPENIGGEFLQGAALSAPLGAAGAFINRTSLPQRLVEQVTKDIPMQTHLAKKEAQNLYNDVTSSFGDVSLFGGAKFKGFKNSDDILGKPPVDDVYTQFLKEPTVSNAHRLKSQIGVTSRKLEKKTNPDDRDTRAMIQGKKLLTSLNEKIENILKKQHPKAAEDYALANQIWASKYLKYKDLGKKIRETAPEASNIASALEKFARKESREFEGKVVGMAPEKISQQSEALRQAIEKYGAKKERSKLLKHAAGAGIGATVGSEFVGGPEAAGIGAGLGAIMPVPGRLLGGGGKTGAVGNLIRQALLANILAGQR